MAPEALTAGTVLQHTYRIVRRIGRGGMGEVYEATHARLAGRYAVKLLLSETAAQPEAFARFRREAEVTSSLRHPNIVQVVDFNHTDAGVPYLVMEFLEGSELSKELAEHDGPLPLARVQAILRQVASALTAAHNRGIIHRDLKPENIFLGRVDGEDQEIVKILDFGISKVKEATSKLTRESAVFGTAHYMSPEQALGQATQLDARSDLFALGSIVYQMLTGREPFQGDSVPSIVYQVVHEEPQPLELANPRLRPEIGQVVRRAMAKDRDQRFGSVREFYLAFASATGLRGDDLTPPPLLAASNLAIPALGSEATTMTPPAAAAPKATFHTTLGSSTGQSLAPAPRARKPRSLVLIAGGVVAAGALAVLLLPLLTATRTANDDEARPPASAGAAPRPTPGPTTAVAPVSSPAPSPAAAAEPTTPAAAALSPSDPPAAATAPAPVAEPAAPEAAATTRSRRRAKANKDSQGSQGNKVGKDGPGAQDGKAGAPRPNDRDGLLLDL